MKQLAFFLEHALFLQGTYDCDDSLKEMCCRKGCYVHHQIYKILPSRVEINRMFTYSRNRPVCTYEINCFQHKFYPLLHRPQASPWCP